MKKIIFVIGAGNGLGNAVARKFASNDFKVVLMSRKQSRLDTYKAEFEKEGIETAVMEADASDNKALSAVIKKAKAEYGVPDVLFYNVGVTCADHSLGKKPDEEILHERYQVDVVGAYTAIQTIADEEFAKKAGVILITGGGISLHPNAEYLPLSMDKAALRAMVLALNPVYKERNIFIGSVQICGSIGKTEKLMPDKIAEQFWKLFEERQDAEIIY